MRLGYQTNGLQNHRLGDALRLLAEHGYEAVGITPDTCHLDPATTSDAELDATAHLLAELRLLPVMETGARFLLDPRHKHEPTLMTADPAARQRRFAYCQRAAAMGARLGAKVLSFWAGIDHRPDAGSRDRLLDGVRRACALVRAEGLEPSFEPEPGMAVGGRDMRVRYRQAPDLALWCERIGRRADRKAAQEGVGLRPDLGPIRRRTNGQVAVQPGSCRGGSSELLVAKELQEGMKTDGLGVARAER
jgi:hypothetical protein